MRSTSIYKGGGKAPKTDGNGSDLKAAANLQPASTTKDTPKSGTMTTQGQPSKNTKHSDNSMTCTEGEQSVKDNCSDIDNATQTTSKEKTMRERVAKTFMKSLFQDDWDTLSLHN